MRLSQDVIDIRQLDGPRYQILPQAYTYRACQVDS